MRASVAVEGRTVQLRAWAYHVEGCSGHILPVYLLDADLFENAPDQIWEAHLESKRELVRYVNLYRKLEETVFPIYYADPSRFVEVRCHAIALKGGFFNTQRMIRQYIVRAYF